MEPAQSGINCRTDRNVVPAYACDRRDDCGERVPYRTGRTGAVICSVRSRSVMSTTVSIGAVSS